LKRSEFLTTKQVFKYYDVFHQKQELTILENQLAYTFCQVPVIYTLSDKNNHILLESTDGSKVELDGNMLDKKLSNPIFNRDGKTVQIKVFIHNNILFNR
jgi:midasin (ATPase involved in ribosome maturation)